MDGVDVREQRGFVCWKCCEVLSLHQSFLPIKSRTTAHHPKKGAAGPHVAPSVTSKPSDINGGRWAVSQNLQWHRQQTQAQRRAAADCAITALDADEQFLGAWPVFFINKWDKEQERLLLLSNEAFYRVKYDYAKSVVERQHRMPLREIRMIQRGHFDSDVVTGLLRPSMSKQYGMRIFAGDHKSNDSYYHTFKPMLPSSCRIEHETDVINEILKAFQDARLRSCGEEFPVHEFDVYRGSGLGPLAAIHDLLGLGVESATK